MDSKKKEDLSTHSFQQKIFDWFDRRGMLSELRSHLRHQMITAFQDSSISNPNPTGRFTVENPISPALQAFLLLVAEFLAQQEYHYTVSILVAEVPVLAKFQKFSAQVSHLSDSQLPMTNGNLPKFSEKDVVEIVETLGIEPESESCQHIVRLYLDSAPRESLLACILTALPAVAKGTSSFAGIEPNKDPENITYYIEEIRLVLLRAQLNKNQLRQLEDVLRRFHASAAAKARQEERELCLKEAENNNQQLRVWENATRQRQRDAEMELEASKRQLQQVTAQLRVQHDDVLRRLQRVQKHADEVRVKEEQLEAAKYENEQLRKHLDARNEKLVVQQTRLQDGFRSLQVERDNLQTLRAEMQGASQREKVYISSISEQKEVCVKLQSELEKTRLELNEVRVELKTKMQHAFDPCRGAEKDVTCRSTQTEVQRSSSSSSSVAEPASSSSSSEVQSPQVQSGAKVGGQQSGLATLSIVRHLRQENAELQERNGQLQRRLEEVTEQAAIWASSPSRIVEAAVTRPPAPLPLPPQPHPRRVARSCDLGAGEELGHPPVRQPGAHRDHTLHLHGREWKRSAPKQLLMHVVPSDYPSSDESVSEEVLRETGRRLRHLDAESKLLDRRRKELKESTLTNTASYMFIPTASTPTLPPPAAARPYEPGNLASRRSLFPSDKTSSSLYFGLRDSTLGRYSQITWPDLTSTSTPLRPLDSPLRRGVRSHLSFAKDRRNTAGPEERVTTSPLRSAERNAFLRLDSALDNIKLARENLQLGPEPEEVKVEDKKRSMAWDSAIPGPNQDGTSFRPDSEFESPSHIRDRVMATLRAVTPAFGGLITKPSSANSEVLGPAAATSGLITLPSSAQSSVPVARPASTGLPTKLSSLSVLTPAVSGLVAKLSPVQSLADITPVAVRTPVSAPVPSFAAAIPMEAGTPVEREKQPVDAGPVHGGPPYGISSIASTLAFSAAVPVTADTPVERVNQPVDAEPVHGVPPYGISSIASTLAFSAAVPMTADTPVQRVNQPVNAEPVHGGLPYGISSMASASAFSAAVPVTADTPVERVNQPVDAEPVHGGPPYGISSMASPPAFSAAVPVTADTPVERVNQPVDAEPVHGGPPYGISSMASAPAFSAAVPVTADTPVEQVKQPVDASPYRMSSMTPTFDPTATVPTADIFGGPENQSPHRLSSVTMPELPLAPPILPEMTEDSPKDSTLNEIPTPASSPSMPGNLGNIPSVEDIAKSILNWNSKQADSTEDLSDFRFEEIPAIPRKAAEDLPLKSDAVTQNVVTTDLSALRPYEPSQNAAERFAEDSIQLQRNILKEGLTSDEASASSMHSRISAGSNDDIQKDDSW